MAEVAAGAVIYETASTTAQLGVASYAVAKPSNGLKASFQQFATTSGSASLARSNHTLTVLGQRAYLFGGVNKENKLAGNDVHSFALASEDNAESDYHLAPAIPLGDGGRVPDPRMNHSACAFNSAIALYGGSDASGNLIEDPSIWLFEPIRSVWHALEATTTAQGPSARSRAKLFSNGNALILYGGKGARGSQLTDVWLFDSSIKAWNQLPDAPISTSNAAMAGNSLYLISGTDALSGSFHHLDTELSSEEPAWKTVTFPTNALAPGPRPRENGGLLHITTGYGRNYLLYFFGERRTPTSSAASTPAEETSGLTHWSDMWTFQLPSSDLQPKASLSISEAIKPAKIKDAIRSAFGNSGTHVWEEVEVKPPGDIQGHKGKIHPGPRSSFGYDVLADGRSVVLWGGSNAKGECEGDGWIIQLE